MKPKERDLLLQLFNNQDHFITSQELSKLLSLSERTVRTYIHGLQSLVSENGAEIVAKQGYGYKLNTIRPLQFEMFINKNKLKLQNDDEDGESLDTSFDRNNYILNKLFLEDEKLYLDKVADTLYVSRSTLTKDINTIKKMLQPYELTLVSKPNYGTWVEGKESKKRSFIMDYFFRGARFNSIQEYMSHISYFEDIPVENLIMIVLDECKGKKIKLSDVMIQNVLMHLTLSIKRINKGLTLKNYEIDPYISQTLEFSVAENIIHRLEDELNIEFPHEEIAYLTLHLGAKNNRSLEEDGNSPETIENDLKDALITMEDELGISLVEDSILIKCLIDHLIPMFVRLNRGVNLENPLKEEIMKEHADIFDMTKTWLSRMPQFKNRVVSDDEWAYLSLHFMAAIERMREKNKLQVLVICATGYGSAQLLKNRIEKEFGDYLHVVSEVGYYEMSDTVLQGIDLIISSVNLASVIFGIPFLHVSVFLSKDDVNAIQDFIDVTLLKKKSSLNIEPIKKTTLKARKEIFSSYIKPEYFHVFKSPCDTNRVLDVLLDKLNVDKKDTYKKHMLDQIRLRESMGSFIFSDTVAVPHPAMPVGKQAAVAIGIIPDGFSWDEGHPGVKIVFLLSPSYLANEGLKHITQTIVRLIDAPDLQEELFQEQTFEAFQNIFLKLML